MVRCAVANYAARRWELRTFVHCEASSASSRASVARYRQQPREKRSIRGELTRYVLREEPDAPRLACLSCERSHSVPYRFSSVPGTLVRRGSVSPTKHGIVAIPSLCRTATICVAASVVLKVTPVVRTSPSLAHSGVSRQARYGCRVCLYPVRRKPGCGGGHRSRQRFIWSVVLRQTASRAGPAPRSTLKMRCSDTSPAGRSLSTQAR